MKTRQFLKRRALPALSGMLLGVGLIMLGAPERVQADSTATYNFSGTLLQQIGNSKVTGQFTLDTTNATITAFNFITPVEVISSTGTSPTWTAAVFTLDGTNPSAIFVALEFTPGGGLNPPDSLGLLFRTTLSTFDVSTFYTGVVEYAGTSAQSNLTCQNGCNGYGSTFVTTTPEPSSLLLFGTGVLGLVPLACRRFRRR